MLGFGFMDLSGIDSKHSSYKPFQLSPYDRVGEKRPALVSSLQEAINYVLRLPVYAARIQMAFSLNSLMLSLLLVPVPS